MLDSDEASGSARSDNRLVLGEGDTYDFTPIEVLLAAAAACSAMDVDHITTWSTANLWGERRRPRRV